MFFRRSLSLSIALLLNLSISLCLAASMRGISIALAQKLKDAPPPPRLKQKPQEPQPSSQQLDPGDVVSVDTAEVLLPVTVRNAAGQLVTDLTRKDFRVFEDGVEQPLSELSLRQVPVDVVLMVDASSSVSNNFEDFRRAAAGFAGYLSTDDRLSLIQFDDRVVLLQDWTKSRVQFSRSLRRVTPGMFTRFNDALVLAAREQFARSNARRAIIVLTDGIDSGRGTTFDSALRSSLEALATIYVISNTAIERARKQDQLNALINVSDSVARFNQIRIDDLRLGLDALDVSERNLSVLTDSTGGKLYKPRSFDDLERTYAEVANELRHQYALYYAPINKRRDGRFRKVQVETADRDYRVSARVGYYVPK